MNFLKREIIKAEQSEGVSNLTRRTFLQAAGVGGGLLIGSGFIVSSTSAAADDKKTAEQSAPIFNAFLKITEDIDH